MKRELQKVQEPEQQQEEREISSAKIVQGFLRRYYASAEEFNKELEGMNPQTVAECIPLLPRLHYIRQWIRLNFQKIEEKIRHIESIEKKGYIKGVTPRTHNNQKLQQVKYQLVWMKSLLEQYRFATDAEVTVDDIDNLRKYFGEIKDNRQSLE